MKKQFNTFERGQALLLAVLFFLALSLTMVLGLSGPVFRNQRAVTDLLNGQKSYYLLEAGLEDVAYRLAHGKAYSTTGQLLSIGGYSVSADTSTVSGKKVIDATATWDGDVRKAEVTLVAGDGVTFYYGVQIGQGGFSIGNNSGINGSVYSNGSIFGTNGSYITGDAVAVGTINNLRVGTSGTGNAWANTLTTVTVSSTNGKAYCQTGSGNNLACDTSKGVPATQGFPISDTDIQGWKNDATAGGTFVGTKTINSATSLGPLKIQGDLTVNNTLTVTGTLWITGNVTISNGATIKLSTDYGDSGGIVLNDGTITMGNNVSLLGSGTSGSYLLLTSLSNSTSAMTVGNGNTTEVILFAPNGTINFGNNADVKAMTAKTISLGNNTILNYTTGFLDAVFNSGPTGGFNIYTWKEI